MTRGRIIRGPLLQVALALAGLALAGRARLAAMHRDRRHRRDVDRLSEHVLRDIGLTRPRRRADRVDLFRRG